jgi:hypothetical protein
MLTERDKMFGDGEELTEVQKHQKEMVEEVLESLIEDIEAGRIGYVEKINHGSYFPYVEKINHGSYFPSTKPNRFSLVWQHE